MKGKAKTLEKSKGIPCDFLPQQARIFIAGFVVGEGSIGAWIEKKSGSFRTCVNMANTEFFVMKSVKDIIGVGSLKMHTFDEKYRRRPLYLIDVERQNEQHWILEQITPYLIGIKSEKAKLLHQILTSRLANKRYITERDIRGRIKGYVGGRWSDKEKEMLQKLIDIQVIHKGKYVRNN